MQALGPYIRDFADTAGLICQLDLLIAVDTAIVHLAGALACPVWVLLPWQGLDWRWLEHGDTSPWYPQGMRLFRQPQAGDWPTLIATVYEALSRWQAVNLRTRQQITQLTPAEQKTLSPLLNRLAK